MAGDVQHSATLHGTARESNSVGGPDGKDRPEKPWLNGYPRLIFVCDLADPFTESVDPDASVDADVAEDGGLSARVHAAYKARPADVVVLASARDTEGRMQVVSVTGPGTLARAESLLEVPGASVRFLSAEPLLGRIDIDFIGPGNCSHALDWLIVGAESRAKARRMEMDWARELRDKAKAAGVEFFFSGIAMRTGGSCRGGCWTGGSEAGCRRCRMGQRNVRIGCRYTSMSLWRITMFGDGSGSAWGVSSHYDAVGER